jgi:hypothetical protein
MSAKGMHKKVQFGPGRKKDVLLFLDCFQGTTKHREYWNKWIVVKCWISVLKMPESIQFTAVELNRAISRNAGLLGVYKSSFKPTGKNRRRVTGYYITTPGNKPSEMPGGNSKWFPILVKEMHSTHLQA